MTVGKRSACWAFVLAACPSLVLAQNPPAQSKDKPKPAAKKPAPSFTDEDLKKYRPPPTESTAEPAASGSSSSSSPAPTSSSSSARARESEPNRIEPDARTEAQPPSAAEREGGSSASDGRNPEEESWRARARNAHRPLQDAKERLAGLEDQLSNLRDQLNPMSSRYVMGGNSTGGPSQVLQIQDQISKLEPEVETAKGLIADAEKEWARFLAEARASGANPNWLTP